MNRSAVFLVKSAVKNFMNRQILRNTWGEIASINDMRLQTIFILGRSSDEKLQSLILEEAEEYGDILQYDYYDDYK